MVTDHISGESMSIIAASRPVDLTVETAYTRILVIDDHTVFAQLFSRALDQEGDLECVGTAHDVATGIAMTESLEPDVVVMDVRLGDGDGVAATSALTDRFPHLRVVVLTAFVDNALLRRAAAAGACALLPKNGDLTETLQALRNARRGEFAVHPRLLKNLVRADAPTADPGLTHRELEVLRMLAAGLELVAISRELGISLNTTRGYAKNVFSKLGAHSQLEAVVLAVRRGLIHVGAAG